MRQPSVYGRVSQISAIYLFLCVFYAILRCKSFKISVNFLIELLKIYKNMVLTSFLNSFQPPSIRISLILHLNSVHIKPQQLNRFDSCTDTEISQGESKSWLPCLKAVEKLAVEKLAVEKLAVGQKSC